MSGGGRGGALTTGIGRGDAANGPEAEAGSMSGRLPGSQEKRLWRMSRYET